MQPAERTADALRFEVVLEPAATTEFVLVEEHTGTTRVQLSYLDYDELRYYIENEQFDAAGRERLAAMAQRLKAVQELEDEGDRLQEELDTTSAEQDRLRSNIGTLNSVAGQQQRVQEMAEQLASNEGRMRELRERIPRLVRPGRSLGRAGGRRACSAFVLTVGGLAGPGRSCKETGPATSS